MSVISVPETSRPPVTASPRPGHALVIGAAGFAWCSLALGLSTVGALNAAGSSIILSGTFFYGGLVQLVAGFFALAAGATFAAAFLTAYGAFWLAIPRSRSGSPRTSWPRSWHRLRTVALPPSRCRLRPATMWSRHSASS